MTGPEHFREGERVLARAEQHRAGSAAAAGYAAIAQAHFTAALAAAVALKGGFWDESGSSYGRTLLSWASAAGSPAEDPES